MTLAFCSKKFLQLKAGWEKPGRRIWRKNTEKTMNMSTKMFLIFHLQQSHCVVLQKILLGQSLLPIWWMSYLDRLMKWHFLPGCFYCRSSVANIRETHKVVVWCRFPVPIHHNCLRDHYWKKERQMQLLSMKSYRASALNKQEDNIVGT